MKKIPNVNTHIFKQPGLPWQTSVTTSAQAQAAFDRYAADGVALSDSIKTILETYIDAQVASGNIFFHENILPLGNDNAVNALVGIGTKGRTGTNSSTTFSANGAIFNGSAFIDTLFSSLTEGVLLDDTTEGFYNYVNGNNAITAHGYGASGTNSGNTGLQQNPGTSRLNVNVNTTTAAASTAETFYANQALYMQRRSAAAGTTTDLLKDGVAVTTLAQTSTNPPDRTFYIGGRHGSTLKDPYTGTVSWFGIAVAETGFNHVAHETNLTALLTALGAI